MKNRSFSSAFLIVSGNGHFFLSIFFIFSFHVIKKTSRIKHDFFDKIIETQTKIVKDHEYLNGYYQIISILNQYLKKPSSKICIKKTRKR